MVHAQMLRSIDRVQKPGTGQGRTDLDGLDGLLWTK